ncbi:DUF1015 domain-containing protein [Echinicola shivajiensis]|uniref:DUF1015 domain-containing protein n=1 Tax=Echinicola shivajiensis TaxID=1035916 RepID=UPI001BFC4363|nr:DUF1015 domain-containing protein [Echinicola shivajiensis]
MAEILPLRAWRYNKNLNIPMEELVSPLFDVAAPGQLENLYSNPFNSVHLTLPEKKENLEKPVETLNQWKYNEIILQDNEPGIYVYYQYFTPAGSKKEYCRKGFIAQIKAYDWEEKVILRHEDTISSSVKERLSLLQKTLIQSSPTHGLFEDKNFVLENFMDEAIKDPLYNIKDYQGVREVLSRINKPIIIKKFLDLIKPKNIILADGHHRLQAAIKYKNICQSGNPNHSGKEAYNYHMMYFTNSCSNNLKILPTHRLLRNIRFSEHELINKLKEYFNIYPYQRNDAFHSENITAKWSYILLTREFAYNIVFKPECFPEFSTSTPEVVKELDLSILHYFFIDKIIGIPYHEQRYSNNIEYESNLDICKLKLNKNEVDIAILTRPVKIEEILKVCNSGYTLPQKSTYFYPKLLSGLLFGSIKEEDFNYPYYNYQ